MLRDLLVRYQSYDPQTGTFTQRRTRRAYATLLGLSPSHVTNVMNGTRPAGTKVLLALVRTFPTVTGELVEREEE